MIHLIPTFAAAVSDACNGSHGGNFFGLPHWYDYLHGVKEASGCAPKLRDINDLWLIVAAVIEIMLRIAAMITVGMVIYAGVLYMTSQGEPDKTTKAKHTLANALVGLAIAVTAAFIIDYIAGQI